MIVLQVNVGRVGLLERKGDPPVSGHGNGKASGLIALQSMEAIAGKIQRLRGLGRIQSRKDTANATLPIRANARGVALGSIPLQIPIPERYDHEKNVSR
jgi:hypothetical protein